MRRTALWLCASATLLAGCSGDPGTGEHAKLPPFLTPTVGTSSSAAPTTSAPAPVSEPVRLSVEKYCVCFGPRAQLQIKVKPRIENRSPGAASITADKLRIAVVGDLAGPWTPRNGVADLLTAARSGTKYTLVPPNAHRAFEPVSDKATTWATFWTATELAAGDTYFSAGRMSGDLVFYVPHDAGGSAEVEALALVDGAGRVVGWAPWSGWREYADPGDF